MLVFIGSQTALELVVCAELVQPCYECLQRLVPLAALVERLGGSGLLFIGKAVRKRLEHRVWIAAPAQDPHHTRAFTAAPVLGAFPELAAERRTYARLLPSRERP